MAATRETAQVDVIINGSKATGTIKEMEASVKVLNTQIRNLAPGTQEFTDKVAELQKVQSKLKETKEAVSGVSSETKNLSERMTKLDGGGGIFSRLKQGFTETKESVLGASNGLGLLQLGMFGLIAAAAALIGYSLYSYFTKTDEGATKLEGIIGGLKAAVDRLVGGFVAAGEWMVKAFSAPREALTDIVNFLKSQVEVRVQAVVRAFKALGTILSGDLQKGYSDLVNAQIDFATGVENTTGKIAEFGKEVAAAAEQAYEMAQAMDALADAERGYSVLQNLNKNRIDELLLQSKNRALSEQERIDKLREAGEIEQRDFEARLELAAKSLELAKRQNQIEKDAGKNTDEMAQREVDAVNNILKLENESIVMREKIANREAALLEALDKDREAKAAKHKKRLDDLAKETEKFTADELAFYRKSQDIQIALIEDTYEQKRETARVAAARELEDTRTLGAEKEILAAQLEAKLAQTLAQIDKEESEKRLKKSLDSTALEADTRAALLQLQYATVLNGERNYTAALFQIKYDALQKELELMKLSGLSEAEEIQKKENEITRLKAEEERRRTADAQAAANERKRIQMLELQGAKAATESVMSLIEEVAGENAKATLAYKAFATADVILNGVLEIQRVWAQYGGIPGGQIIAGVLSLAAGARTAIAVQKINSVQAPKAKFARGGVIRQGSRHSEGGIAMIDRRTGVEVGEMERNETILTGGVAANPGLLQQVSRINVLAGGRPLYEGGGIPALPQQQAPSVDFEAYLNEARTTNQLLMSLPTTLEARVSLEKFEDNQTLSDKIKQTANA